MRNEGTTALPPACSLSLSLFPPRPAARPLAGDLPAPSHGDGGGPARARARATICQNQVRTQRVRKESGSVRIESELFWNAAWIRCGRGGCVYGTSRVACPAACGSGTIGKSVRRRVEWCKRTAGGTRSVWRPRRPAWATAACSRRANADADAALSAASRSRAACGWARTGRVQWPVGRSRRRENGRCR